MADYEKVLEAFKNPHTCLTCKHCDKKITETPCDDCDNPNVSHYANWEACDGE